MFEIRGGRFSIFHISNNPSPLQQKILLAQYPPHSSNTRSTFSIMFRTDVRKGFYSVEHEKPQEYSCIQPTTLPDRKSTRLNSSHVSISYAVFCLKKKR